MSKRAALVKIIQDRCAQDHNGRAAAMTTHRSDQADNYRTMEAGPTDGGIVLWTISTPPHTGSQDAWPDQLSLGTIDSWPEFVVDALSNLTWYSDNPLSPLELLARQADDGDHTELC